MRVSLLSRPLVALALALAITAHADPVVDVTISGTDHYGDDPFTYSFSFEPAAYTPNNTPGYETDFIYFLGQGEYLSGLPNIDTVDFFDGGRSMIFFSTVDPTEYLELNFLPGSCQSLPTDPFLGITPTFTTKTCSNPSVQRWSINLAHGGDRLCRCGRLRGGGKFHDDAGALELRAAGFRCARGAWRVPTPLSSKRI